MKALLHARARAGQRLVMGLVFASVACIARGDESLDFFESRIRPVLIAHCYECHAGDEDGIEGGLRLDQASTMHLGGTTGPAVVAGDPNASLLLSAIKYEDFEMPPSGPLDERVIRDFEEWIRGGAAMPKSSDAAEPAKTIEPRQVAEIDWEKAKTFWAYRPPCPQEPPSVEFRDWPTGHLDRFILHRLEQQELSPGQAADRHQFIRRLSFDLTGLPPTAEEVDRFLTDDAPDAKERVVDRLLSKPGQAEHLTRLWLDIVRYAEDQAHQVGDNVSLNYPNAYLYRDWVVEAFAEDLPYDRFIELQLAADALEPDDPSSWTALGFLGLGPKYYRRGSREVMADEWENAVDTVTRGVLGLTVACARCHDHKYDPIPTADYYALAGVFASTELFNKPLSTDAKEKAGQAENPADAMHIVRDVEPVDLNVMIRGDVNRLGEVTPRAFLRILSDKEPRPLTSGSGRLDLARAITEPTNPLTARVIVNRIWARLLGQPLVNTQSNFGQLGETPTHPELLDDLAVRFMAHGWSIKWLQREIVLSATYGQSSQVDVTKQARDPANKLYWRMPRRRLSVEAYRDAVLVAVERLDRRIGGPSIRPDDPAEARRTLYAAVSRMDLNPLLARFDFPDPNAHSDGRYQTTTPLQKLFLLNSPFLVEQSNALANRMIAEAGPVEVKVQALYRRLYARGPTDLELRLAQEFLQDESADEWSQYIQTLLISNEMFMID